MERTIVCVEANCAAIEPTLPNDKASRRDQSVEPLDMAWRRDEPKKHYFPVRLGYNF